MAVFTRICIGALALALPLMAHANNAKTVSYGLGFPPVQSAIDLAKRWTPVLQYLSEQSGVALRFQTAKDIDTFQHQLRVGHYDIAFTHPLHYLSYHKMAGYNAFAGEADGETTGLVVVRKDSALVEIEQLNGQALAFPSPNAAAATLAPMQFFRSKGVNVSPKYVNSLDSVYRAVAKGLFIAGGGESRTLSAIDPEVRNQLRVLWTSDPTPSFLFASHPRVPKEIVEKIQRAMADMDKTPQGQALLKSINFKAIKKTEDKDYNDYRKSVAKAAERK